MDTTQINDLNRAWHSIRMAMDLIGAMLILYFTYWIGRSGDFEVLMLAFFATVILVLPAWLRISRHTDKATIFIIGSAWWAATG